MAQVGLVGHERGRVVMGAKGFEGRDGRFDHGDVAGLEDLLEDLEDTGCEEGEVFGRLLDQRRQDLERDLDVPVMIGQRKRRGFEGAPWRRAYPIRWR